MNCEIISIVKYGKFLTESPKTLHVQSSHGHRFLIVRAGGYRLAVGIDDHRAAAIVAGGVVAHAVYADDEALVFQGTGLQQRLPNVNT